MSTDLETVISAARSWANEITSRSHTDENILRAEEILKAAERLQYPLQEVPMSIGPMTFQFDVSIEDPGTRIEPRKYERSKIEISSHIELEGLLLDRLDREIVDENGLPIPVGATITITRLS